MSRRARAAAFAAAALGCAALAAGVAGRYGSDVAAQYGELRPVVVTRQALPARRPLRKRATERLLEVRRVPVRFAPPDALADPGEALGRVALGRVPAGSYLVASQLAEPRRLGGRRRPRAGPGRTPVEIAVMAAGAIEGRPGSGPARVDVVVTTEPRAGAGRGRTHVAARDVGLLGLRPADDELHPEQGVGVRGWIATLALTRAEALRLIQAESFARQIRLIGRG